MLLVADEDQRPVVAAGAQRFDDTQTRQRCADNDDAPGRDAISQRW
jgi:hypothetical protein